MAFAVWRHEHGDLGDAYAPGLDPNQFGATGGALAIENGVGILGLVTLKEMLGSGTRTRQVRISPASSCNPFLHLAPRQRSTAGGRALPRIEEDPLV